MGIIAKWLEEKSKEWQELDKDSVDIGREEYLVEMYISKGMSQYTVDRLRQHKVDRDEEIRELLDRYFPLREIKQDNKDSNNLID
jgi:hypothetical protein